MSTNGKENLSPLSMGEPSDRITMVLDLHHEQIGDDPKTVGCRASRNLITKDVEPYQKRIKVGEEPQPLDTGWVEEADIGYIAIENLEGTRLQTQPSDEELEAINKRIVVVSFNPSEPVPNGFIIRPGWCFPFEPSFTIGRGFLKWISLSCLSETAKCKLSIFPK